MKAKVDIENQFYWICDAHDCYFVREHGINYHLAKCTTKEVAQLIVRALKIERYASELIPNRMPNEES